MKTFDWERVLSEHGDRILAWLITSGASILAVLVLALVLTRAYRLAIRRLGKVLTEKAHERLSEKPEEATKRILTLSGLLRKVGVVTIWTVAWMVVLKQVGLDIGPILAGAGIIGLAVGFGAQNLVRDVISGFFIILENQIRVGDVAVVNGTGGLVEGINLRTVVLRDLSGVVHIFPNGTIDTISNMTKGWSAMVFDIGVAYKEDTDRVVEVMSEVAAGLQSDGEYRDKIIEPLEVLGVDSFGDSAVVIKARLKTRPIQQWAVGREYRRRLKKAFDEQGIEIPFPHRTIYWGDASRPFELLVDRKGEEKASS